MIGRAVLRLARPRVIVVVLALACATRLFFMYEPGAVATAAGGWPGSTSNSSVLPTVPSPIGSPIETPPPSPIETPPPSPIEPTPTDVPSPTDTPRPSPLPPTATSPFDDGDPTSTATPTGTRFTPTPSRTPTRTTTPRPTRTPSRTPTRTVTPTPTWRSVLPMEVYVRIKASGTHLQVGDELRVDVTATNLGKRDVEWLQYHLALTLHSGEIVLSPVAPRPVTHDAAIAPGQSDSATFLFLAVCPGDVSLDATVIYETPAEYPYLIARKSAHTSGPVVQVESINQPETRPVCRATPSAPRDDR